MHIEHDQIQRRPDGSIDLEFYRHRAVDLRGEALWNAFSRDGFIRTVFYAGALGLGLVIGVSIPIQSAGCGDCRHMSIDDNAGSTIDWGLYAKAASPSFPIQPSSH